MKASKTAQKKWAEHCRQVQEMTVINFLETDNEKANRIQKAKTDYEFFVGFYFPHYIKNKCGKFQIDSANKVAENKKLRGVFEFARAHGKSVHFDLLIPLWLLAKGELNVMILVGKSMDNAITLLGDLQAELVYNERYKNDFGERVNIGTWEEGRFKLKTGQAFFALGRGMSPRGLRYKQNRPDYIVVDDIDDDALVQNDSLVNKMVDFVLEALFNAMDMGAGRFVLVGNRISNNSVLAKVAEIPGILHLRVNALDENGEVVWKEKYSKDDIQEVISTIGERRAQKELFNNPISDGAVFKLKNITYTSMDSFSQYRYVVSYTDPSFKSSSKSDYKATVLTAVNSKGEFHILKSYVEKTTVSNMVNWHYQINTEYGSKIPIYYYMEANFVQDILFKEFYEEGLKMGFQIPIIGDKRSKPDKFQRIESLQPLFQRGLVFFNEKEKDSEGMKTLINQLLMTEKGSRYADDGPDSLEGAIWLLLNKVQIEQPIIIGLRGQGKYRNVMRY